MGEFSKSTTLNGKYKYLCVENGGFINPETGEIIDVASELEAVYGAGEIFSLSTTNKVNVEIEPKVVM